MVIPVTPGGCWLLQVASKSRASSAIAHPVGGAVGATRPCQGEHEDAVVDGPIDVEGLS